MGRRIRTGSISVLFIGIALVFSLTACSDRVLSSVLSDIEAFLKSNRLPSPEMIPPNGSEITGHEVITMIFNESIIRNSLEGLPEARVEWATTHLGDNTLLLQPADGKVWPA